MNDIIKKLRRICFLTSQTTLYIRTRKVRNLVLFSSTAKFFGPSNRSNLSQPPAQEPAPCLEDNSQTRLLAGDQPTTHRSDCFDSLHSQCHQVDKRNGQISWIKWMLTRSKLIRRSKRSTRMRFDLPRRCDLTAIDPNRTLDRILMIIYHWSYVTENTIYLFNIFFIGIKAI